MLRSMLRATGKIRDFVTVVTSVRENAVRLTKKLCLRIVASLSELAFALLAAEKRLFMDGELIAGDVVRLVSYSRAKRLVPRTQRLVR